MDIHCSVPKIPENYIRSKIIISSEYMTLEGRKISTSNNWAIWAKDIVSRYNPDALRYFFLANGPEKRDTDFSWREFIERNNGELLGAYGNFVHRTLAFIQKYFGGTVPEGAFEPALAQRVAEAYACVGEKIEAACLKEALDAAFDLVRSGNRYFDEKQPWKTRCGPSSRWRRTSPCGSCWAARATRSSAASPSAFRTRRSS
jgi:methionyl-tRNA synthetase